MSREYYLSQNGVLRLPNYFYENNKAISDKTDRIYLIGKTFDKANKK